MTTRRIARIASTDARGDMADLINAVAFGDTVIVLQRHGRDVAALVPIADLERLGLHAGDDTPPWKTMRRSKASQRATGG